eukprot:gene14874-biopygen4931
MGSPEKDGKKPVYDLHLGGLGWHLVLVSRRHHRADKAASPLLEPKAAPGEAGEAERELAAAVARARAAGAPAAAALAAGPTARRFATEHCSTIILYHYSNVAGDSRPCNHAATTAAAAGAGRRGVGRRQRRRQQRVELGPAPAMTRTVRRRG